MTFPALLSLRASAIAAGISLTLGLGGGWKLHDALVYRPHLARDAQAVLAAEHRARAVEAGGAAIASAARDAHDSAQARIRTVTQTIVKEVPRYVSSTVKCAGSAPGQPGRSAVAPYVALGDVSVGFGLLHDAAATGRPPLPVGAGVDLDAARGTGMPAVAAVIARNYGLCLAWREEAASWRDWYARESGAWPVK